MTFSDGIGLGAGTFLCSFLDKSQKKSWKWYAKSVILCYVSLAPFKSLLSEDQIVLFYC